MREAHYPSSLILQGNKNTTFIVVDYIRSKVQLFTNSSGMCTWAWQHSGEYTLLWLQGKTNTARPAWQGKWGLWGERARSWYQGTVMVPTSQCASTWRVQRRSPDRGTFSACSALQARAMRVVVLADLGSTFGSKHGSDFGSELWRMLLMLENCLLFSTQLVSQTIFKTIFPILAFNRS